MITACALFNRLDDVAMGFPSVKGGEMVNGMKMGPKGTKKGSGEIYDK